LSPILVRPIREQLEHDRIIRTLRAKYKRKSEVSINPGNERTTPVVIKGQPWYPDLVIQSLDARPKLLGMVEVETAESVNHLEAMSQWLKFSRLRAPFHLYIPVSSVDATRRLCTSLKISVSEIWAYNALGDEILFTVVHKLPTRKSHAGSAPKKAKRTGSSKVNRAAAKRTKPRKISKRKTERKGPVVRVSAVRKVSEAGKRVGRKSARKVVRGTRAAKVARTMRTVKKTSKSSRPKKR